MVHAFTPVAQILQRATTMPWPMRTTEHAITAAIPLNRATQITA